MFPRRQTHSKREPLPRSIKASISPAGEIAVRSALQNRVAEYAELLQRGAVIRQTAIQMVAQLNHVSTFELQLVAMELVAQMARERDLEAIMKSLGYAADE